LSEILTVIPPPTDTRSYVFPEKNGIVTFVIQQEQMSEFNSKIQCGMFKGTTRAVFINERNYEGMLWQQV